MAEDIKTIMRKDVDDAVADAGFTSDELFGDGPWDESKVTRNHGKFAPKGKGAKASGKRAPAPKSKKKPIPTLKQGAEAMGRLNDKRKAGRASSPDLIKVLMQNEKLAEQGKVIAKKMVRPSSTMNARRIAILGEMANNVVGAMGKLPYQQARRLESAFMHRASEMATPYEKEHADRLITGVRDREISRRDVMDEIDSVADETQLAVLSMRASERGMPQLAKMARDAFSDMIDNLADDYKNDRI